MTDGPLAIGFLGHHDDSLRKIVCIRLATKSRNGRFHVLASLTRRADALEMASLRLSSFRFYTDAFRKSHHPTWSSHHLHTTSSKRSPVGIALYTTAFTVSAGLLIAYYL